MDRWYAKNYPDLPKLRDRIKEILTNSEDLEQVVQLVGKTALGDSDKITLDISTMIKEEFLAQNGFSAYDQYSPLWKTAFVSFF